MGIDSANIGFIKKNAVDVNTFPRMNTEISGDSQEKSVGDDGFLT